MLNLNCTQKQPDGTHDLFGCHFKDFLKHKPCSFLFNIIPTQTRNEPRLLHAFEFVEIDH